MNHSIRIIGFANFVGTCLCERLIAAHALIQASQSDAVRQMQRILFLQLL